MPGVLREAIGTELWRRNPSRHADLQNKIVRFFGECIESGVPGRSAAVLHDFYDTFAHHPVLRMFSTGQAPDELSVDVARPSDRAAIEALLRREVSAATAAMTQQRVGRFPDSLFVARARCGRAVGLVQMVVLSTEELGRQAARGDAVLAAFAEALRRPPGVDAGGVLVVPFVSIGPGIDATLGALAMAVARMAMRTASISGAFAFLPVGHPLLRALQFLPPHRHELLLDGARYALVGCDFASVSRAAVLARLLACEPETPSCPQPPPDSLDEAQFTEAVRACLPHLALPVKLAQNPLVDALIVRSEVEGDAGVAARAAVLARVMKRAIENLAPHDERAHRVLRATFVTRVGTHEEISEDLDLSYSTFRRHLARAIELLARTLVLQEVDLRRRRRLEPS